MQGWEGLKYSCGEFIGVAAQVVGDAGGQGHDFLLSVKVQGLAAVGMPGWGSVILCSWWDQLYSIECLMVRQNLCLQSRSARATGLSFRYADITVKVDSCEVNTMPLQGIYPACKVTRSQVEQRLGRNIAGPMPGLRALTPPARCRGTRRLRSRSTRPIGASVSVTQNQSRIYGKAARGNRKFASRRGAAASSSSSMNDSNIRVKGVVQWANFLRLLARAAKRKGE